MLIIYQLKFEKKKTIEEDMEKQNNRKKKPSIFIDKESEEKHGSNILGS